MIDRRETPWVLKRVVLLSVFLASAMSMCTREFS